MFMTVVVIIVFMAALLIYRINRAANKLGIRAKNEREQLRQR